MVTILVILVFLIAIAIDITVWSIKEKKKQKTYFNSTVGLTMADGGEPIKKDEDKS